MVLELEGLSQLEDCKCVLRYDIRFYSPSSRAWSKTINANIIKNGLWLVDVHPFQTNSSHLVLTGKIITTKILPVRQSCNIYTDRSPEKRPLCRFISYEVDELQFFSPVRLRYCDSSDFHASESIMNAISRVLHLLSKHSKNSKRIFLQSHTT